MRCPTCSASWRASPIRATRASGYAVLTDAGRRLHEHASKSVDPIAAEALAMIPKGHGDAVANLFVALAGIHRSPF